jgi:hypothetical protein
MKIPDYFNPIISWRGWRVGPDGGLYGPARTGALWIPGEPCRALCDGIGNKYHTNHKHPTWTAPQLNCTCGFYSYKTLHQELLHLVSSQNDTTYYSQASLGQVKIWGRVIEHADGWRSQYAYPHAIIVGRDQVSKEQVSIIKAEYKIEVEEVASIASFLSSII